MRSLANIAEDKAAMKSAYGVRQGQEPLLDGLKE